MLIAAVTGGVLSDLRFAVVFGAATFSGAGCIGVAAGMRRRARAVSKVYLAVAVLAIFAAAFAEAVRSTLFPYFYLFSALLLITLGLELLGISAGIKPVEVAKVGFATALLYSLLHPPGSVSPDIELRTLFHVLLSVAAGYVSTLAGAGTLSKVTNPSLVRRTSGFALLLLGLGILMQGA